MLPIVIRNSSAACAHGGTIHIDRMSEDLSSYSHIVLDHFQNPRNFGDIEHPDGVAEVGAASCGDIMRLSLRIRGERIEEARFRTYGCGPAIASSSITTELVRGRTVAEAQDLSSQQIMEALGGLPPAKLHCTILAEETLKAALANYHQSHPGAKARQ